MLCESKGLNLKCLDAAVWVWCTICPHFTLLPSRCWMGERVCSCIQLKDMENLSVDIIPVSWCFWLSLLTHYFFLLHSGTHSAHHSLCINTRFLLLRCKYCHFAPCAVPGVSMAMALWPPCLQLYLLYQLLFSQDDLGTRLKSMTYAQLYNMSTSMSALCNSYIIYYNTQTESHRSQIAQNLQYTKKMYRTG